MAQPEFGGARNFPSIGSFRVVTVQLLARQMERGIFGNTYLNLLLEKFFYMIEVVYKKGKNRL